MSGSHPANQGAANMALTNAWMNMDSARAPGVFQPWQAPGFLQAVFGEQTDLFNVSFSSPGGAHIGTFLGAAPSPPASEVPSHTSAARLPFASGTPLPGPTEGDERRGRLLQWMPIIERAGDRSAVCAQLHKTDDEGALALLDNVFANKSTATLAKRASSIGLFIRWYEQKIGHDARWPPSEEGAYAYVEHLRAARAPPTRAKGFLEAIAFCKGALLIRDVDEVLSSPRVSGAASRCYEEKRLTKKATPLTASTVIRLEKYVLEGDDLFDRCIAGFLLFLTFARSRCRDASRIREEPQLDPSGDGSGFVQTAAERVKGTRGQKRARLGLPVVAYRKGLSEAPWADEWLAVRKQLGLDARAAGGPSSSRGPWLKVCLRRAHYEHAAELVRSRTHKAGRLRRARNGVQ